jgi:hypothetical protein
VLEQVAAHYRARGYKVQESVRVRGDSGAVYACDLVVQGPLGDLVVDLPEPGEAFMEIASMKSKAKDLGTTGVLAVRAAPPGFRQAALRVGIVVLEETDLGKPEPDAPSATAEEPAVPWPDATRQTAPTPELELVRPSGARIWKNPRPVAQPVPAPGAAESALAVAPEAATLATHAGALLASLDHVPPASAQAPTPRQASAPASPSAPARTAPAGSFAWLQPRPAPSPPSAPAEPSRAETAAPASPASVESVHTPQSAHTAEPTAWGRRREPNLGAPIEATERLLARLQGEDPLRQEVRAEAPTVRPSLHAPAMGTMAKMEAAPGMTLPERPEQPPVGPARTVRAPLHREGEVSLARNHKVLRRRGLPEPLLSRRMVAQAAIAGAAAGSVVALLLLLFL